jgi:predicted GNAT family acetyltransferase
LEIRRISDPPGLRAQVAAMAAAFDTPPEVVEKMMAGDSLLYDADIITLAGYCDGKVVCGATCHRVDDIATVHGVATIKEYRRRGFGRAITLAAAREGVRLGCKTAALRASGASFEMYRRLGFVHVCNHRTYARPTGEAAKS